MSAMTIAPAEYDFRAARRRLEAKPKSAGEKLTSLEDAAARVPDGATLAFGGILYSRTPLALFRAVLRRRPKHLTLVRNLMCYEGEWGMVAGAVDAVRRPGQPAARPPDRRLTPALPDPIRQQWRDRV